MNYYRIHSDYKVEKTQQPLGLFVLIWTLVDKNMLTDDEASEYWTNRKWFEENLPIPPFYDDGNKIGAITWFKNNVQGNRMFDNMSFYLLMAKKYELRLFRSECNTSPGKIIYEDDYQIGVVECDYDNSNIIISEYCS